MWLRADMGGGRGGAWVGEAHVSGAPSQLSEASHINVEKNAVDMLPPPPMHPPMHARPPAMHAGVRVGLPFLADMRCARSTHIHFTLPQGALKPLSHTQRRNRRQGVEQTLKNISVIKMAAANEPSRCGRVCGKG